MKSIKNMKISFMLTLISGVLISVSPYTVMAKDNEVQEENVRIERLSKAEYIKWIYKTENGKVYKRLKNETTGQWLTDWILVG